MTREEMMEDLLVEVLKMRGCQRAYFESRGRVALVDAKNAEHKVDRLVGRIVDMDAVQLRLF